MTLTRAALRAALPALGTAMIGVALLADACPAQAFTPTSKAGGESTPLHLAPSTGSSHSTSSGGASIVRTIVGLLIVIAVIWGLTWILKQVKTGRETRSAGSGLTSLATLALGSGRTLHLVRAGRDYLLVGSAEHGVAPIHRYTEQQAREAGLLDLVEPPSDTDTGAGAGSARAIQIPGQARPLGGPGGASGVLNRLRERTVRR
ncbi:MAG TPA: flagellar biosynthetic protein FliO [Solirubrobacteraceae bacterium]|nr:flagellar biosynthetic protein FliO [Solirubrobacteraceae bacterium]